MTNATLSSKLEADSKAKLAYYADRINTLEEIAEASEDEHENTVAAIIRAELDEACQIRSALLKAHIKVWGC